MDNYLASLLTERVNERTKEIDRCDTAGILNMINAEDRIVPVDMIVAAIRGGGRLFYFGAGTSGRLGVLDASECTPTFGVSHDLIQGHIAGGDTALRNAVEDSEDSEDSSSEDEEESSSEEEETSSEETSSEEDSSSEDAESSSDDEDEISSSEDEDAGSEEESSSDGQ